MRHLFLWIPLVAVSVFADQPKFIPVPAGNGDPRLVIPEKASTAAVIAAAACFAKAKVDTTSWTAREKAILASLLAGKGPDFSTVTDAWLEAYLVEYNARRNERFAFPFTKALFEHAIGKPPSNDPFAFKKHLEQRLEKDIHKKKLVYNGDYTNPLDLVLHGKAQCASGTTYYCLAARTVWDVETYRLRHPVVIFMKGHVLPGFVLKDEKGETHLVGLESTISGEARRNFGKTLDLARYPQALRVVDAEVFALLDLFGDRLPESVLDCLLKSSLEATAKQHGLDLPALEKKVAAENPVTKGETSTGRKSPFGFGKPTTPPGDRERSEGDLLQPADPGIPDVVPLAPPPRPALGPLTSLDEVFAARDQLLASTKSKVAFRDFHLSLLEDAAVMLYARLVAEMRGADFPRELDALIAKNHDDAPFDRRDLVAYLAAFGKGWNPDSFAQWTTPLERAAAELEALKIHPSLAKWMRRVDSEREANERAKEFAIRKVTDLVKANEYTDAMRLKIQAAAVPLAENAEALAKARRDLFAATARGKARAAALAKRDALSKNAEKTFRDNLVVRLEITDAEAAALIDYFGVGVFRTSGKIREDFIKHFFENKIPAALHDEARAYLKELLPILAEMERTAPPYWGVSLGNPYRYS